MNKIPIIFIILSACFLQQGRTQDSNRTNSEARIRYERTEDYISIVSKLNIMSKEEIDRMDLTWGTGRRGRGNRGADSYELLVNSDRSIYTYAEEEQPGSYRRRGDFVLLRDLENQERIDYFEFGGDNYIVKDEWSFPKWKILDKIKDVNGYICMQAETRDTIKNQVIHAWFTDQIPYPFGPEGYGGLPGMILELEINGGDAVITATSIDLNYSRDEIELPKKMKGKSQTLAAYNAMISKYMAESLKAKRNPFWVLRY